MGDKQITAKEVLIECLQIMREEWKIASKSYLCLEPKKGMEKQFNDCMEKCRTLERVIQAMDTEEVRAAMAGQMKDWQREVMTGEKQTGLFAPGFGEEP